MFAPKLSTLYRSNQQVSQRRHTRHIAETLPHLILYIAPQAYTPYFILNTAAQVPPLYVILNTAAQVPPPYVILSEAA